MLLRWRECLFLSFLLMAGCRHASVQPIVDIHPVVGKAWRGQDRWFYPQAKASFRETGLAILTPRPENGLTADGEVWSADAMTGAHQTLQLPLVVRVKNLQNGRVVHIRLNDRGPADGRRVLGISPLVARLLGAGKMPVPVEITPDQGQNDQMGYNDAARPKLDISLPQRGAVKAESLDGQPAQTFSADAAEAPRHNARYRAGDFPRTYTQEQPQYVDYTVVLGFFYNHQTAARLAARCAGRVQRSIAGGSAPSWQVVYGPYSALENADDAQRRAQHCGINNPVLMIR